MSSPFENLISPSRTAPVRPLPVPDSLYLQNHTRALVILKRNLHALLTARKESQVALARHVRHSKAWINKFLNDQTDTVEIQIKDVDRIASFFGVEPYQLFQPGISALTERRHGSDRRSGTERRVGHSGRELAILRTELDKHPALASSRAASSTHHPSAASDPVQRAIERFAREIQSVVTREQAATLGVGGASLPRDRRKTRRSITKPA